MKLCEFSKCRLVVCIINCLVQFASKWNRGGSVTNKDVSSPSVVWWCLAKQGRECEQQRNRMCHLVVCIILVHPGNI